MIKKWWLLEKGDDLYLWFSVNLSTEREYFIVFTWTICAYSGVRAQTFYYISENFVHKLSSARKTETSWIRTLKKHSVRKQQRRYKLIYWYLLSQTYVQSIHIFVAWTNKLWSTTQFTCSVKASHDKYRWELAGVGPRTWVGYRFAADFAFLKIIQTSYNSEMIIQGLFSDNRVQWN